MGRNFAHLSYDQRLKIKEMLDEGISKYRIADEMGMDPSTIYREIKKGLQDGKYNPDYANKKYRENLSEKGPAAKLEENKELAMHIADMILKYSMSPERIVEELKLNPQYAESNISIQTIYTSIDKGRIPGVSRETLRKEYVSVFSDGQMRIPKWVLKRLEIKDGDKLSFEVTDDNRIIYQKVTEK